MLNFNTWTINNYWRMIIYIKLVCTILLQNVSVPWSLPKPYWKKVHLRFNNFISKDSFLVCIFPQNLRYDISYIVTMFDFKLNGVVMICLHEGNPCLMKQLFFFNHFFVIFIQGMLWLITEFSEIPSLFFLLCIKLKWPLEVLNSNC